MDLAISNVAWTVDQDQEVVEVLSRHRIAAVEVAPTKYWPAPCQPSAQSVQLVRSFWQHAGLRIQALQSLLFGMPTINIFAAERANERDEYLLRILTIGSRLGATRFVFGSPRNRDPQGLKECEARTLAVEFFRRMASAAADLGTVFCLEPNPPEYHCAFLTTAAEVLSVVKEVNHPGLGLILDSGIMLINDESPSEVIAEAAPWLKHFHVSHPHLLPVNDKGPVNHALLADVLRRIGYDHCASVEMRSCDDSPENLRRLTTACEVLNRYYRN